MSETAKVAVAVVTSALFLQAGCYNTYFIEKNELEKLQSGVEIQRVVTVQADCSGGGGVAADSSERPQYAAAESEEGGEQASDAKKPPAGEKGGEKKASGKCTSVPVSTTNPIQIVEEGGAKQRVTPFNFMMSQQQLVSPEYDYIASLDTIQGAEVREFSTIKTVGMIAGVSAVTIGAFVGISLTSPDANY